MSIVMEDSLSTRSVDVVVTGENQGASTIGAGSAVPIGIGTIWARAPAHGDTVNVLNRVVVGIVRAALSNTEEHIPEVVSPPDIGTFHFMNSFGPVGNLFLVTRPEDEVAVDGDP